MKYSLDSKIGDLLKNETIKAKMTELAPKAMVHPYLNDAISMGFSLEQCASMAPGELPQEVLDQIAAFLATVE